MLVLPLGLVFIIFFNSMILTRSAFLSVCCTMLNSLSLSSITSMSASASANEPSSLRIMFHGGDNMLGRAVQLTFPIQAPGEEAIQDSITASHYVDLCLNHPSGHRRVDPGIDEIRALNANRGSYLWGDYRGLTITPPPDLKVLNLETAVTKSISNKDIPRKGINYHMHIDNFENILSGFQQETHGADRSIPVVVSLANNHVLDYGRQAFEQETMPLFDRIRKRDFQVIGAGRNLDQASDPAKFQLKSTIVQVFGFSTGCSGTPAYWFADDKTSGLVGIHSLTSCPDVHQAVDIAKTAFEKAPESQIRIVSIHWGPNWALRGETKEEDVTARRYFAHRLIDECNVDLIYGHSSHHARGMEVYKGKLILYGTGDIINDYEGFENPGEEKYNRLGGIYLVDVNPQSGDFQELRMIPMCMNRLRLERFSPSSRLWRPNQRTLELNPNKSREFCSFLNEQSVTDAGGRERALLMNHYDADPQVPGGPVLRNEALCRSFA